MVPNISRRCLLATCSAVAGSLATIPAPSANRPSTANRPSPSTEWRMEQRDPAGTGHAEAASGPRDGVRVRWKRPLETERGFAYLPTPVVADGRVYGVGRELLCLDAADGSVIFRDERAYRNPPAVATARAYQSPTVAFASRNGVDALHPAGGRSFAGIRFGRTRWQWAGGNEFTVFGPTFNAGPPVAADGTVFATILDDLVALDASSGRVRWRVTGDGRRPAVRDGTVYVPSYEAGVLGYDVETGERTFSSGTSEFRPISVTAAPDRLVVGTDSGLAGVEYDGTTRWQFAPEDLDRDYGAVAVGDGVAYAGIRGTERNWLVAVDVADGTERWRSEAAPEQEPQSAPPSVADGIVYVPTEDAGLAAVDAGDGHVRWQFDRGERSPWSPAALVEETLYAVGNGHLYALEEA